MADEALDLDLRLRHVRRAQQQGMQHLHTPQRNGAVGRYVPAPPPGSHQAVVKGWISKAQTTGNHLQYMQKGKGRDGHDASLFGPDGHHVDPRRFATDAQQDGHQYRFTVSLADPNPFFPMRPYIESLMAAVQHDLGRALDWLAAVHYDTKHTHAHVILRGRDLDRQSLSIKNPYLTHGLRHRATRMATWMFGAGVSQEQTPSRNPDRTPQQKTASSLEPMTRRQQGMER